MSNRATKIVGSGLPPQVALQIAGDVQSGVTALGSTQATAQAVYGDTVVVSTAAASTGVILGGPGFGPGDEVLVANQGANAVTVYPPVGGQINAAGVNAGVTVAAGKASIFRCAGTISGVLQFYTLAGA